ncbi:MAG: nucleotidyl transferase AbiEii/AbiGii toxin family protein [Candidatus Woesearchaeota archaeon]
MDEEKKRIIQTAAKTGFAQRLILKDYYLTQVLYAIKDVKNIFFKGGTALNKIFLNHARLSEDIDFTVTNLKQARKDIQQLLRQIPFIQAITTGKDVKGFVRIICEYETFTQTTDTIYVDLNENATLLKKPQKQQISHYYENIPVYEVFCLDKQELIAEKVAATIQRNKPRDHYDIYQIIKHQLPISMQLVTTKCAHENTDELVIRMFSQAKKLYNRWDEDMVALLQEPVSFHEVMQVNAKYFTLSEVKERLQANK